MGFLKHFRSRSRLKNHSQPTAYDSSYPVPQAHYGRDFTKRLPEKVLETIFTFICPHVQDRSYEPSERSQIGDGCMLCDLRDLARCAQVSKKWYGLAQNLLYTSVRIDAVHYCALEEELAERRKKAAKHFRSKSSVEPVEVPSIRLQLLCRTVRDSPRLANLVLFLKLPYMTRETAKGDLARTVSVLPNLRYVDLPDGFYSGDPSCLALRQELQARCPDIRKMSYRAGAEDALELLAQRHWQSLEILELAGLALEPVTLRIVLASLPTLHELTLSNMDCVDDAMFAASSQLPDFPALQTLKLENLPHLFAQGVKALLQTQQNRQRLHSLTLQTTGIAVQDLPELLWEAPALEHLSITETVSRSLAMATQLPPLTSISLKTLHFEISSSEEVHGLQKPAESYYSYLASSLHHNALPALQVLYVRDQSFPDLLLLPSLPRKYANAAGSDAGSIRSKISTASNQSSLRAPPFQGGTGFSQTLEVFSKGIDELEWVFTSISPPNGSSHEHQRTRSASFTATGGRPLSAYSASRGLGPQWAQGGFGGEARKSVVVGNGFGGFLAVPQEEVPRPMTSDGARRGSVQSYATGGTTGTSGSVASKGSFLKPPPSVGSVGAGTNADRRVSRHDLWR